MQFSLLSGRSVLTAALLAAALTGPALCQTAQAPATPAAEAAGNAALEKTAMKGTPPRTSPAEYQAAAKMGPYTIAADFAGHSAPTPDGVYTTEDFLVAEVALYGPADKKVGLSYQDFSLRINGGKKLLPATGYEFVFKSLKDPEWVPPEPVDKKSGSGITTGGGASANDPPPVAPKMPFDLQRKMDQKVQKASLPDGQWNPPVAGLIYFQYGGRLKGIHSVELIYNGAAGKATIPLQ